MEGQFESKHAAARFLGGQPFDSFMKDIDPLPL
jgi:hypothetical protein